MFAVYVAVEVAGYVERGGSRSDGHGFGQDLIQARDEETGPGLEVRSSVQHLGEFLGSHETTLELVPFTYFDGSADADHLHDAYVYRSDRVGVIVQKTDPADVVRASYCELLGDFTPSSRVDRIASSSLAIVSGWKASFALAVLSVEILRVDVAPDSDRMLLVES